MRYEAVNAMLLNEFLKEHREVQELKKQPLGPSYLSERLPAPTASMTLVSMGLLVVNLARSASSIGMIVR